MLVQSNVLSLLSASASALKKYEDEVNRLNVYPVPDGDTGTNMLHTMQSVISEVSKTTDPSIEGIIKAVAYGSLMGARGNSGVILSQIIKGICEEAVGSDRFSSDAMIRAIRRGADIAYRAVTKPVEGTMLTVINDMAKAAESLSGNGIRPIDLLERVVEEGRRSVERTPVLLPVLKEAGVVDAGGYGLVVLAQGILSALKGETVDSGMGEEANHITVVDENAVEGGIKYGYCTELLLKSNGIDMKALEVQLDPLGDSMLIVGSPELTRIHIHTNDPGHILSIATSLGSVNDVQINNIIEQSKQRNQSIKDGSSHEKASGVGVIAVANGEGIKKILVNLGVGRIVSGGQSMNPSTADIVAAVKEMPNKEIIILPNNKNIILTARQTVDLTDKKVSVIPTRSIPEAFSALLSFDSEASLEDNIEAMEGAFEDVKTGEITHAVRDGNNGKTGGFSKDDLIGLHKSEIHVTGTDLVVTTLALIESMLSASDEVVTVLAGEYVTDDEIDLLSETIEQKFPDLELDMYKGNQPIYHFIIGIE
ncbi:MAG: DAK2 domain-containing protein [Candidatus Aquicultor sp.]